MTCPAENLTSLMQTQPVKQLLAKTRELMLPVLTAKGDKLKKAAAGALPAGAVALLANLLHQLQQDPSLQVISVDSLRPYTSAWYCMLQALCAILAVMREQLEKSPGLTPELLKCREQLLEAGGEKRCEHYAGVHAGLFS